MANDLIKHSAGVTESGIDVFNPDFNPSLVLSPNSYNLMTGINRGTGPRYGMSPIPGHSNLDTTDSSIGRGIRSAELTTGDSFDVFLKRRKFLGVLPVTLFEIIDSVSSFANNAQKSVLFWLITDYDGVQNTLTFTPNAGFQDGSSSYNQFIYTAQNRYGFYNPIWAWPADNGSEPARVNFNSPLFRRIGNAKPTYPAAVSAANLVKDVFKFKDSLYYSSNAVISVSGRKWPMKWLIGSKLSNGDSTHSAIPNFVFYFYSGTNASTAGVCPAFNLANYKKTQRTISLYNLYANQLAALYTYSNYSVDETTYPKILNQNDTSPSIVLNTTATSQTLPDTGGAYAPASVTRVLLNDNELECDSSYRIALVAAGKPYAYVVQDWERDLSTRVTQAVDLTNRTHVPRVVSTTIDGGGPTAYKELSYEATSCFQRWPTYDGSTALPTNAGTAPTSPLYHVTTGAAGSGVLRSNTTYEFTFSFFDKQYGIESNVGKPAKFLTGTEDFVALSLKRDQKFAGVYVQNAMPLDSCIVDDKYFDVTDGTNTFRNMMANFLELRFYYRPYGSFEWLPALYMDFAQWLGWPNYRIIWSCTGDIAALPGGQPGGFIDYSQLPPDTYDCVVNFKNRAFWLSKNNLVFSLANNPFAYPLRNSAPAQGGYRGAIVHTYRGQSSQESRIVIFGDKENYIGKFTGEYIQQPVQVSADTVASYDLDGSDFRIEAWTSVTAFSHRSAVVADGDLYWWGPQGIYKDDGVNNPTKVSGNMEPDIFTLYEKTKTDEIHCIYDETTKHIIWFYPPASNSTITHLLTLEVSTGQIFLDRLDCKVDWAQRVDIKDVFKSGIGGVRTMIGARETGSSTIQRGYYFDQINRAGDWAPKKELLVKSVSAGPTTLERVLALDSGVDATNFATIAIGDYITIHQFKNYTTLSTGDEMISLVTGIDTGAKTLTIKLPDDGVLPTASLAQRFYFPIWHAAAEGDGLNGIPWVWETKYWMPQGVNYQGIWLWLYLFIKYTTWLKRKPNKFNVEYRTPTSGAMISDPITMVDNSDGNFQLFHALRNVKTNNQGQAIKFRLSGTHIGEEWMLQYLEAHALEEAGNILKRFQG